MVWCGVLLMPAGNLFAQYLQPPKSMADYGADMDRRDLLKLQLEGAQGQNQLLQLTRQQQMEGARQGMAKQSALQRILSDPSLVTPEAKERAMLSDPYLMEQGMAAQKARLENSDKVSQTKERDAKTAHQTFETRKATAEQALKDISQLASPEEARASLQAHLQAGDIDQTKYQSSLATLPQNPADFPKWQVGMLKNIMAAKDRMELERHQLVDQETGRHNKASETTAAGQLGVAQGNLGVARQRLALDQTAPKGVYDPDRGVMVDPRTANATPVTTNGQPLAPKDKPLPEAAQKQVIGTRNLQDAVGNYTEKLKGWGNLKMLSPDARAEMGNAYNNMMLQAKEAYNLGVLNGPDYEILQSVVKDPTKLGSAMVSNEALGSQATELARIAANIERTSLEAHGKKYMPRETLPGKPIVGSGVPAMSDIDAEIARRKKKAGT